MPRHTRARRLFTVVWALVQLLAPLAAAQADAGQSVRAAGVQAHVEDVSGDGCVPVHAGDCVVCKQLTLTPLPAGAPTAPPPSGRASLTPPSVEWQALGDAHSASLPRAPPSSSR